jgi:hypothetical protein
MVTKYKIAVNGTKQPATTSNNQIIQQIAQNTANQQLQNQAQAQAEAIDPMRQTVNDLLKNKLLNNIEVPRFTTVQDILDAPKGSKLETFGKYLGNNSDVTRLVGTLFGGTMRDSSGNFVSFAEPIARRQEALMQAEQQKALSQLKEQNDIATALNQAFNQRDIADENNKRMRELAEMQNEWQKERFAQEMALRQQQLNAQIQHQRAMEGLARERLNNSGGGGSVTGGASNLTPKQIQKNQEMLNSLNAVQSQMDRFANSFDKVRGSKAGALLADAYAKGGFGNSAESNFNAQRTLLFNKIARELGGEKGVLSDQDIKRIEGSLPSLSDSLPQKRAKMKAVYDLLEDRKSQYDIGTSSGKKDSLGLGI